MTNFNNKKVIIFCLSYLEVEWTLQLIEENGSGNCIVVTQNAAIKTLLIELYSSEIVFSTEGIMVPDFQRNPVKFISNFLYFFKQKNKIRIMLSSIKDCNIYFFFVAFGLFESYLIRLLSKNNRIFYKPVVIIDSLMHDNSFKAYVYKYFILIILNVPIISLKNANCKYRAVSKLFLKKINSKTFEIPDKKSDVINLINFKYPIKKFKVLILAGYSESKLEDRNDFLIKYNDLIDFFVKKFGNDFIALKDHPNSYKSNFIKDKFYEIPSYLPGSLIIDHFQIICGEVSSLLYEAANKNKISISTLDYCSVFSKKDGKAYLAENLLPGKEIIYFNDLKSLEEILYEKC